MRRLLHPVSLIPVLAALQFAPLTANADACAPGLAAYPEGCCNGRVWASCITNVEYALDCSSTTDPNQGCIWDTGLSAYGCGDTTVNPSVDPSLTYARACSCTIDCAGRTCGSDGCGGQCGVCTGSSYCDGTQCVCSPDCTNRWCGDDGCGGTCGDCTGGQVCYDPAIGCENCQPDCTGKQCGSDGCGGQCGLGCGGGMVCNAQGQCDVCVPDCAGKICGSDGCSTMCGNCPSQYDTCSADQTTCIACVPACSGKQCGDNGCGGTCGTCGSTEICTAAQQCVVCTPDCTGKQCGDDGCGGSCGTCTSGTCSVSGVCDSRYCRDIPALGCCDGTERLSCSYQLIDVEDCAATGGMCGLSANSFGVAGCFSAAEVTSSAPCPAPCTPNCTNKNCGDDGCNNVCGVCGAGQLCNAAQQCEACVPACSGRVCGYDFCGGSCGTCTGAGEVCTPDGQCVVEERTCANVPVGGCCEGGIYKQCDDGPMAQLRCSDFGDVCGSNWFGGFAGCWPQSQYEGPKPCACIPKCTGKECGPDGCGGVCGTCHAGQDCDENAQCVYPACPDLPDERCCTGEVLSGCSQRGALPVDCKSRNQYCGWDSDQGVYGCVDSPNLTDPAGALRNCPGAPTCTPSCTGRTCGSDGCGGSCGTCPTDRTCDFTTGTCVGETMCSSLPPGGCCYVNTEYYNIVQHLSCSSTDDYPSRQHCGLMPNPSGWGSVQGMCGWADGRVACVPKTSTAQPPSGTNIYCPTGTCIPKCDGTDQCGADGCGGVCGICPATHSCVAAADGTGGHCVAPCSPSCAGRTCGSDGCGGSCGDCNYNEECKELELGKSACVFVNRCNGLPDEGCCDGRDRVRRCHNGYPVSEECGSLVSCGWYEGGGSYVCGRTNGAADPSGVHPKTCPGGSSACVPRCGGKECGVDGCGGSCGTCTGGMECDRAGKCRTPTFTGGKYDQYTYTFSPSAGCCYDDGTMQYERYNADVYLGKQRVGQLPCYYGCGFNEQYQMYMCNEYGRPALPSVDPAGNYPRVCQAPTCTPSCAGKQCGDDGCGGSCGSCADGSRCYENQCYNLCTEPDPRSHEYYTEEGRCSYATLYFCDNGLPAELNCNQVGSLCGWNELLGAYSCGTSGEAGPAGTEPIQNPDCAFASGTCGFKRGCGINDGACPSGQSCSVQGYVEDYGLGHCVNNSETQYTSCKARCFGTRVIERFNYQCSCNEGCEVLGDPAFSVNNAVEHGICCTDYAYECQGAPSVPACGDGFCFRDAGESCASCPGDCGACPAGSDTPPWNAPYDRAPRAAAGGGVNDLALSPLDDVLPVSPPVPTDALMMYVPAPGIDLGPPGSRTNFQPGTDVIASTTGRLGQALRFFTQTGQTVTHAGDLTWLPDGALPRVVNTKTRENGGMSVAMWINVPDDIDPAALNPLWTGLPAPDAADNTERLCLWPRKYSSPRLKVACPRINGQESKITDIRMYAGGIVGLPAAPDGNCLRMSDYKQDATCQWSGAEDYARTTCLGQGSCTLKFPDNVPGCVADSPSTTMYVEAVCSANPTPPELGVSMLITPSSMGHQLALSAPGASFASTKEVTTGEWHHVGFTFQPFASEKKRAGGIATLYLDGEAVASNASVRFPRLRSSTTSGVTTTALNLFPLGMNPSRTATSSLIADVDELFVYGRAITDGEMSSLARKGTRGLRMVWPENGSAHRFRNDATSLSLVTVDAPHLLDVGAPGGSRTVRREQPALHVGNDRSLEFGKSGTHDLAGLSSYTLMAWVRQPASGTLRTLMSAGEAGTDERLKLERVDSTGACGGRALVATFSDGTVTQTDCSYGFDPDRWVMLAVTQGGGKRSIYVDAVLVAESSVSNPAALFVGTGGSPRVAFRDVDVFWAGLFQRALSQPDLAIWRGQGPLMWTDGAKYTAGGAGKVRDYALYQERGVTTQRPTLWQGNTPLASASGAGPLALDRATTQELTIPASVHFARPEGSTTDDAPRIFSYAARVVMNGDGTYPLVDRQVASGGQHVTLFRADLECSTGKCQVTGKARVAGPGVTSSKDESRFSSEFFTLGAATEADVALSFDGRNVLVAMGVLGASGGASLESAHALAVDEVLQARSLPSTTAAPTALTGSFFRISAARATATTLSFKELRFYPRAISPVELAGLARRDCNNAGCSARGMTCHAGSGMALPSCSGCEAGAIPASDGAGSSCISRTPFMAACTSDEQCQTGLCVGRRCVEGSRTEFCTSACAALGRNCEEKSHNAYGCSDDCKEFYRQDFATPPNEACFWSPETENHALCETSDQCLSGACITAREKTYSVVETTTCPVQQSGTRDFYCRKPDDNFDRWKVWASINGGAFQDWPAFCLNLNNTSDDFVVRNVYAGRECPPVFTSVSGGANDVKRCAEQEDLGCTARNRKSTASRITRPGEPEERTVYTCSGCLDTTFNGVPLYVEGFKMMKPELCKTVREKIVDSWIDYRGGNKRSYSYPSGVGADVLKQLLLTGTGSLTPAEYSQLEKMGFGPTVLNFDVWPAHDQLDWYWKWGGFLDFEECGVELPPANLSSAARLERFKQSKAASPFHDLDDNAAICRPNKFPNGTPCPPPGANLTSGDSPHSFCDSGFCARDTGVCEEGYGRVEDTNGESRADDKKDDDSEFPVSFSQTNRTSMEVRTVGTLANGQTKKREYTLQSVNDNTLTFFGSSRSIMRIEETAVTDPDDEASEFEGRTFFLGLQVPSDDPAVACEGASWNNGEYQPPPPGSPRCAPAEDGITPAIPVVKLCLPSPAGCEDVDPFTDFASNTTGKGPMCVKKTFLAGPVPITMQAEVTLDACIGVGFHIDDQTQEPAFRVVPELGVGVDLRGGVGGSIGPVEVFAGARAVITILGLEFPIAWGLVIEKKDKDPQQEQIENLYVVKFQRTIGLDITVLKLALSLFAEVGVGIFMIEWDQIIFEFGGLQFHFDLASTDIQSKKVDFEHPTAAYGN
ncbi:MAG: hypothetical protein HY904_09890 [Deltaproteobacteria bacterium]|nr:hypothetical protein [Deltaproteobacteria bacterium]